jgi:hypothetical protein
MDLPHWEFVFVIIGVGLAALAVASHYADHGASLLECSGH